MKKQEESKLINSEPYSPRLLITRQHIYISKNIKKQASAHKQVLKTQSIKLCLKILNEIKELNVAGGILERCPEKFTGMSTQ